MPSAFVAAALLGALAGCDAATPVQPSALGAGPALAANGPPLSSRDHYRFPMSFESWSPCTREHFQVSGTVHTIVTGRIGKDGVIRLSSHSNSQGMGGRGVESGRQYRFISLTPHDHSTQETSEPVWRDNRWEMESRLMWQVVSQGAANNFYVTLWYTILYDPQDPARSGFRYVKSVSGCRG
jgi:hypothetical protein